MNETVGRVSSIFSGIARVQGLPDVAYHEVLLDEKGMPLGLVIGYDDQYVDVLLFDENINSEQIFHRSSNHFSIPVSEKIIGRVLNALGKPLDGLGPLKGENKQVFKEALPIIDREPVNTPIVTGIKLIDATLPLGRGQRELIIGDRKLGKSTLAKDIVLNQKNEADPVYCIYVLCGQKTQELIDLINLFEKNNTFLYSTIVAASADASFAEIYLVPFVGCAIAEYFLNQGKDVLIVYDDLSKHARTYRDIALLLERAPGREAYPGDIFTLHAQLLERSAKRSSEKGGGSLTALPILETEEGDITAFIPTNLISITDGQIYFDKDLFHKRFLPAVNLGLSVSRIGSKAQPDNLKKVTGGLRISLAHHKEVQRLAQLDAVATKEGIQKMQRGDLILESLKQWKHSFVSWPEQVVIFYSIQEGLFDEIKKEDWKKMEEFFLELLQNKYSQFLMEIEKQEFTDAMKNKIKEIYADFKKEFLSQ